MRAQCWAQAVLVALLFALFVLAVETVHRSPDHLSLLGAEQNEDRGGPFAEYLHLDSRAIESRQPGHRVKARFAVSNHGREDLWRRTMLEERRYVSQRALLDQADCRIVGARKPDLFPDRA